MAFCQRCSLVAFAEVLDQFSGIGCYSGTARGMHLQKFWISFAESSVMMTSKRHFGRRRRQVRPGTAFVAPLWRQVGHGLTLRVTWRRQVCPQTATETSGTALGVTRRRQVALGRPFGCQKKFNPLSFFHDAKRPGKFHG